MLRYIHRLAAIVIIIIVVIIKIINHLHHHRFNHHHQYIGHIMGGLVTRYRTKKIEFLDFLCSSNFSSIFFRIFSLIPNNASIQEVV